MYVANFFNNFPGIRRAYLPMQVPSQILATSQKVIGSMASHPRDQSLTDTQKQSSEILAVVF